MLANSLCETANNISKYQSTAETLKKRTLAAKSLACCVFKCTNPEQTWNTQQIKEFTVAGTREVAKLWYAGFSYVQISIKPCSNMKSIGVCHQVQHDSKGNSNWLRFFFFPAGIAVFSQVAWLFVASLCVVYFIQFSWCTVYTGFFLLCLCCFCLDEDCHPGWGDCCRPLLLCVMLRMVTAGPVA